MSRECHILAVLQGTKKIPPALRHVNPHPVSNTNTTFLHNGFKKSVTEPAQTPSRRVRLNVSGSHNALWHLQLHAARLVASDAAGERAERAKAGPGRAGREVGRCDGGKPTGAANGADRPSR